MTRASAPTTSRWLVFRTSFEAKSNRYSRSFAVVPPSPQCERERFLNQPEEGEVRRLSWWASPGSNSTQKHGSSHFLLERRQFCLTSTVAQSLALLAKASTTRLGSF